MTWTFTERAGSGKFRFSDDGSARGTISIVAELSDVSADHAPAKKPAGTSADLLTALKANFPIGGYPTKPTTFQDWYTTWGNQYRISGYSGAVPANSRGTVWFVDIEMAYAGSTTHLQGASLDALPYRKDVDISVVAASRSAATFMDWGGITSPSFGDADWTSPSSSLEVTGSTRLDVNGQPITTMIPGARVTVSILHKFDPSLAVDEDVIKRVGFRNKSLELNQARGLVLFEGLDVTQIGHGFGRYVFKFYSDIHAHLQQEQAVTGANGPVPSGTTTAIGAGISVEHYRAVWRQPYGPTSDENAWDLEDLFIRFTTGNGYSQSPAQLAAYVNERFGED